jgi:hypothetical protein
MFFITQDWLDHFENNPDNCKKEIEEKLTCKQEEEFLNKAPYYKVEKKGKVFNFIHVSDWHFPNKNTDNGKLIKKFQKALTDAFLSCKGKLEQIDGIISSGDHINAKTCSNKVDCFKDYYGYLQDDLKKAKLQINAFCSQLYNLHKRSARSHDEDRRTINDLLDKSNICRSNVKSILTKIEKSESDECSICKNEAMRQWENELSDAMNIIAIIAKTVNVDKANMLMVPGNHDIVLSDYAATDLNDEKPIFSPPEARPFWKACKQFLSESDYTKRNPVAASEFDDFPISPVASISLSASGVVVFVGFDSTLLDMPTHSRGIGFVGHEQTELAERFLRLIAKVYADRPVMAVGVLHHHLAQIENVKQEEDQRIDAYFKKVHASDGANSLSLYDTKYFFKKMSAIGMKLFLHGHKHSLMSYDLYYSELDEKTSTNSESQNQELSLLPPSVTHDASCCALGSTGDEERHVYKLAAFKVDFERGMAYYSPLSYNAQEGKPKEIIRDAISLYIL